MGMGKCNFGYDGVNLKEITWRRVIGMSQVLKRMGKVWSSHGRTRQGEGENSKGYRWYQGQSLG